MSHEKAKNMLLVLIVPVILKLSMMFTVEETKYQYSRACAMSVRKMDIMPETFQTQRRILKKLIEKEKMEQPVLLTSH